MYKCIEQGELTMTGIYDVHLSGRIADVNPFAEIIMAFQEASCLFFQSYTFIYIFIDDIVMEVMGVLDGTTPFLIMLLIAVVHGNLSFFLKFCCRNPFANLNVDLSTCQNAALFGHHIIGAVDIQGEYVGIKFPCQIKSIIRNNNTVTIFHSINHIFFNGMVSVNETSRLEYRTENRMIPPFAAGHNDYLRI